MSLRIVFMGTPEFAVPTLLEIVGRGHEVVAVYTRAPKPGGRRGLDLTPSPIEREARRFALPVFTPATLRTTDAADSVRAHDADVAVVVAYGLILAQPILEAYPLGAFNLHATAGDLHARLARLGADLMVRALGALERGTLTLAPQPQAGVTYAHKIAKEETRVAWERPWQEVHNHIRGLSPAPGAWFEIAGEGVRVKALRTTKGEGAGVPGTVLDDELTVACGEGALRILELQRAGRQAMKAHEFLRGTSIAAGTRFG